MRVNQPSVVKRNEHCKQQHGLVECEIFMANNKTT